MIRLSKTATIAVLGLAAALAGCDDPEFEQYRARRDSITTQHGDSVKQNIAVHTIDPWPKHSRNTTIGMDGHRAVLAGERYRANRVIEPRGLGGGASGGGGAPGAGAGAAPAPK